MNHFKIRLFGMMSLVLILVPALVAQQSNSAPETIGQVLALQNQMPDKDSDAYVRLNQIIELHLQNATLEEALNAIADQANLKLMYRKALLSKGKRITYYNRAITVYDALWDVLDGTGIQFAISQNRQLVLLRMREVKKVIEEKLQETVRGQVIDAQTNEPLPGVNIVIDGTNTGATTDSEGNFELEVLTPQETLVFSYIGYERLEVPIEGRTELNIRLIPQVIAGEEMVVVGYGLQRRSDLTSAISSVSPANIENLQLTSIDQALQGQVAGVRAQRTTGTPGGGMNIQIRGVGSITAGNQPLYVIDGFPVEQEYSHDFNPLSSLNPDDIESIEILKDASSAAIYGSRGSNGVVLVTTKTGRGSAPRIQINSYTGVQEVQRRIDMMDPVDWTQMAIDSRNNAYMYAARVAGIEASPDDPNEIRNQVTGTYVDNFLIPDLYRDIVTNPGNYQFTDWQDEIFRRAVMHTTNISVSGGLNNVNFYVSGGYQNQDGVVIGTGFERYSFRANVDFNLSDNLRAGINLAPSYSIQKGGNVEGSVLFTALRVIPLIPFRCTDDVHPDVYALACGGEGQIYGDQLTWGLGTAGYRNPIVESEYATNNRDRFQTLGNLFVEYNLLDKVNFRSSFGANLRQDSHETYRPSIYYRNFSDSQGEYRTFKRLNWLNENTFTYHDNIGERQSLTALIGFSVQKDQGISSEVIARNFPNDLVRTMNAGIVTGGHSFKDEWSLLSYLARINYAIADRYLFTATIRRDGSSRFGAGSKWGNFPSISAAWIASEEDFMQGLTWLSNLKIRGSYGFTGNFSIPNYGHIARISQNNYVMGEGSGNLVSGVQPVSLSNANLGWERTGQFGVGLEIGLFEDRLSLEADYYDSTTDDMLLNVPIPSVLGFNTALTNIGSIQNKGWEFTLRGRNLLGGLLWTTDFNIYWNRNTVLALGPEGDPIISGGRHITQIGEVLGSYYGYIHDGIFQTWEEIENHAQYPSGREPEPGDVRVRDVNGDGLITPGDQTIIGNSQPDFMYGWTNNFYYRNFDLRIVLEGAQGYQILSEQMRRLVGIRGQFATAAAANNYWRSPEQPGDGQQWRPFREGNLLNADVFSHYVQDASYLNINNITLGYRIPPNFSESIGIQSARFYFSIDNAWTFTKYDLGYNPEGSITGDNPLQPSKDEGSYPVPRIFNLGVTLDF